MASNDKRAEREAKREARRERQVTRQAQGRARVAQKERGVYQGRRGR